MMFLNCSAKISQFDKNIWKLIAQKRMFSVKVQNNEKEWKKSDESKSFVDETIWNSAKPFEEIPGPSQISLLCSFMPGGQCYKQTYTDVLKLLRDEYGDIYVIPGLFGKRNVLVTFDPKHFENIFRTESQWPLRRGLDSIEYYRKTLRKDFYTNSGGLVAEQKEGWASFRKIVNPIMMQPKIVKLYIPSFDDVAMDFVERIKSIRNPKINEVPSNFDKEIQQWAMESIGLVALDKRLNLINGISTVEARKLINAVRSFFRLLYELDVKPSLWKFMPTRKFNQFVNHHDTLVDICTKYIEEAIERINTGNVKHDYEKSVLEKLLHVNKQVAIVMAMDLIIAGIDTTTTAFTACLFQLAKNQEAQDTLRAEIQNVLPSKDSRFSSSSTNNMPYLRACIKEALRLYPVTVGNMRTAGQDLVLSGYRISRGTDIAMVNSVLQREDAHFPQAIKFRPERWLRSHSDNLQCPLGKNVNPFIYLPFGFGPRMCIGKRFIEVELEVVLSRIVRNFRVEYHYPDFVFQTNVINSPYGDFRFRFIDNNI